MNRYHKIFKLHIEHTTPVRVPDPEAPMSGEMVNAGTRRAAVVVNVIAECQDIAMAWARTDGRFINCNVVQIEEQTIAAVIETHTY